MELNLKKTLKRTWLMINEIIYKWPKVFGGGIFRYWAWSRRLKFCGSEVRFDDGIKILGFRSISIGSQSSFMSNSYIYAVDGGLVDIGNNCSFNHNVLIDASYGSIIIGNDALIGPNVVLRSSNHSFSDSSISMRMQGHQRGEIKIGNNVWLGAGVIVTPNVHIGDGCIVGAGSIVTRSLPSMTICAGNPARVLKPRLLENNNS